MLARLSAAAGASQVEFSPGDERFSLNMETLRLVLPVPDITWTHVAKICERAMNPMYHGLYSIVERDMEHVAQLLAALESDSEQPSMLPGDSPHYDRPTTNEDITPDPMIIPSLHPSVPTIVITPCPWQPRGVSSQIPYQDSAFRNQLTVPSLSSFNQSFPPMMAPRRVSGRGISHWIWKNGHWHAILNGLEPRPRILKPRKRSRCNPIKSKQS
ncbi:hypothetical protein C8R43DRAFT_1115326 [Mycena crocata]|nr:hypothetical protein C8R43DRAFT_1115326 [Mycena crocata]